MASKYAINLKDERIVYRSKATDAMPVLFRWIPDDVAKGIMEGKISAKKVVNIITRKMFQDENFDHSEYEAELKKLNVVFKEEEVPEPEEVVNGENDNIADTVSMSEVAEPPKDEAQSGESAKGDKPDKPKDGAKGRGGKPGKPGKPDKADGEPEAAKHDGEQEELSDM